ncbi:MAG: MFS transporter [Promicromonosporaceae bacterium]|nr:MFS transporter [Promicromonosporaceae bacterium]
MSAVIAPERLAPAADDARLPRLFTLRFASRGASVAVNTILTGQVMFYATTVLGLAPGLLGLLFMLANLVDGVVDLGAGALIDRTNTRFGKGRPYELVLVPMWLLTIALFSTPQMSPGAQTAYVFIVFVLISSFCRTLLGTADGVYLKRALSGDGRYAKLSSRSGVVVIGIAAAANLALPQAIAQWGERPGGWSVIATLYGLPMMALGLVRFFTVRERPDVSEAVTAPKVPVRVGLRSVFHNRYVFVFAGMVGAARVASTITGMVGVFFFTFVLGDVRLMSFVMLGGLVTPVVMLCFPAAARRIGSMNFIRLTLAVAMVGYAAVWLFPHRAAVVIGGQMVGALSYTVVMLGGYFMLQCMSYGEWRTGIRADATTSAVVGIAGRLGAGIAAAIVGALLAAHGLEAGTPTQPEAVGGVLTSLYALVPFSTSALMFALTFAYRLDRRIEGIRADLQVRAEAGVG